MRRPVTALLALALVVAACAGTPAPAPAGSATLAPAPVVSPAPLPEPGHEVYAYVPYWEMDESIADHVAGTSLTTLGLFSVTNTTDGQLDATQPGFAAIVGPVGRRLVADARERGVRVELVYTSFGSERNDRFFADGDLQDATIDALVGLTTELALDGVNVDVEALPIAHLAAYGAFVGRLRDALTAADPAAQVSVATAAAERGVAMASVAALAGADRVFVMGYDYHWSGSAPGASAPLDRADDEKDLVWTLDRYAVAGVPVERTLLGLPLYGMSWPVDGPDADAVRTGDGETWIPRRNLPTLLDPGLARDTDPLQVVERIALETPDGWRAVYYDSPATLTPKLALADARGLAGAGLWALGYERGLPAYTDLIATFAAGELATP